MGKGFGNLAKVGSLIQYGISPFEQRAFAGAISKGIPNMFRRFRHQAFRILPPFILGYYLYDWGTKEFNLGLRKDPSEFDKDE